jgi:hypothetical protein
MASNRSRRKPHGPGHLGPTPTPCPGPRATVGLVVETEGAQEVREEDPADNPSRPRIAVGVTLVADPTAHEAAVVPRDQVAARAYEIWVRNGRPEGTADRDWLQAEAELRAEHAAGPGSAPLGKETPQVRGRGAGQAAGSGPVRQTPTARTGAGHLPRGSSPATATRATVRLSGNVRHVTRSEWLGALPVDAGGNIERSVDLPEEVYQTIERAIAAGSSEGIVFLDGQRRVDWLLDR